MTRDAHVLARLAVPLAMAAALVAPREARAQAPPPPAAAGSKEACAADYEGAQQLRREGKLGEAREHLVRCAQESCPAWMSRDCIQWLSEVDAALPTVVFAARDASGRETLEVEVKIDGRPFLPRLAGKAVPLDPGEHVLSFVHAGATLQRRLILREGEKGRRIDVSFAPLPGGATAAHLAPRPAPRSDSPVLAYVLGGLGLLGVGSFIAFGLTGRGEYEALSSSCGRRCDPAAVAPVRTKLLVADASLVGGTVLLGVATYLLVRDGEGDEESPARHARSLEIEITPRAPGAVATLRGSF